MTQLLDRLNIRDLSIEERIQLVGEIWDSIADEEKTELTEAQIKEADRRMKLYRSDPSRSIPWDEVKNRLKRNSRP